MRLHIPSVLSSDMLEQIRVRLAEAQGVDGKKTAGDLDQSIQNLTAIHGGNDPEVLGLTGVYHNLVRKWGEP